VKEACRRAVPADILVPTTGLVYPRLHYLHSLRARSASMLTRMLAIDAWSPGRGERRGKRGDGGGGGEVTPGRRGVGRGEGTQIKRDLRRQLVVLPSGQTTNPHDANAHTRAGTHVSRILQAIGTHTDGSPDGRMAVYRYIEPAWAIFRARGTRCHGAGGSKGIDNRYINVATSLARHSDEYRTSVSLLNENVHAWCT